MTQTDQDPFTTDPSGKVERDRSLTALVFGVLIGFVAALIRPRSWKS